MDKKDDHYESCTKLDYYTNYNDKQPPAEAKKRKVEELTAERKDGWVKVYNGHIGTWCWEKE